jgi:hypothetical protein
MADEIFRDMLKFPATPPEPIDIPDSELDAATEAYVRQRWPNVEEWRERFPEAWRETRDRIRLALQAAAKVREAQ